MHSELLGHPVHMKTIFKKKKGKPSFSREIVPSEKVLFFIDKKDMPNKTLRKIPKERKNQWNLRGLQRFAATMEALISGDTQDASTVLSLIAVEV